MTKATSYFSALESGCFKRFYFGNYSFPRFLSRFFIDIC